jgi:hypothetical protein
MWVGGMFSDRFCFATLMCNDAPIFTFPTIGLHPAMPDSCFDKECNAAIGDGGTVPLASTIKIKVPRYVKICNVALP